MSNATMMKNPGTNTSRYGSRWSWILLLPFLLFYGMQGYSQCTVSEIEAPIVMNNSARLIWSETPGASGYEVTMRAMGAVNWSQPMLVSSPDWNANQLQTCTTYEVRVRAICGENYSPYAYRNFTTPGCGKECTQAPQGLAVTNVNPASTRVFWNALSGVQFYEVSYRRVDEAAYSTPVNVMATSFDLPEINACATYEVRVRAFCNASTFTDFTSTTFTTNGCLHDCSTPPARFSTEVYQNNNAAISWVAVPGARAYEVSYRRLADASYSLPMMVNTNRANLINLDFCTQYEVLVRAVCERGRSAYALTGFATAGCRQDCNVIVRGFAASEITKTSARLDWEGISGILTYEITYRAEGATAFSSPMYVNCNFAHLALNPCTNYEVRVRAVCGDANRSAYTTIQLRTLGCDCYMPEDNLKISYRDLHHTSFYWATVENAVGYEVSYRTSNGVAYSEPIVVAVTHLDINTFARCQGYVVRVRAICAPDRYSDYAYASLDPIGCECLTPPQDFSALVVSTNSLTFTWSPLTDAKYYEFSFRMAEGTFSQPIITTVTSAFINGLQACTPYEARVRALCRSDIFSDYDTLAVKTSGCIPLCENMPENLEAVNITINSTSLNWESVSGAKYYEVIYRPDHLAAYSQPFIVHDTTVNLGNLLPCTPYHFQVRAVCGENIFSGYAHLEFKTSCCKDNCNTPYDIRITDIKPETAVLSWECCVIGHQVYEISYRVVGEAKFTEPMIVEHKSTTLLNLQPNTMYQVRIRVNCGNGNFSTVVYDQFTTASGSTCEAPRLETLLLEEGIARISWEEVAGVKYYHLSYKAEGAVNWTDMNYTFNTFMVLNGLAPNTTYDVRVRTVCQSERSDYSLTRFTTAGCARPQVVSVTPRDANSVRVKWDACATAVCYAVAYGPYYEAEQNLHTVLVPASYTSFVISNLSAFENYKVRIRTNCTECSVNSGNTSNWTQIMNFTTASGYKMVNGSAVAAKMEVYPNPAKGFFTMEWEAAIEETAVLKLTDMTGKVVYQQSVQVSAGENQMSVSANEVVAGIYMLELISSDETYRTKLVIE